ncbi:O-acetylhomoserine aminocarboxypropyltransferase/cysteine synthase family protein [Methanosphaerula palustris]|uniref:O-acetylhomoserine aminocarboxypropyltransferase n=1 Tax=Methanosphaerula palustris (strain ATCC BAA-1556 / DSM 19958 / E1-9c) TaxID=521011 RepID=B8GH80_METPE|nr:aminotransferase class I/II-fold pyridoxal phosphate-dependent enzyme [Methanosphaerula palustris]ACL16485.1 O-acetylhomoserine aminocarboxypropyltransferase [Methanosphaerula palustris E1-9c]
MKHPGFTTRAVHGPLTGKDPNHALQFPIYAGVAHDFETAETMADTFAGRKAAFAYSRIANPTVSAFERKITALEDGLGTVAVSSGMAAISNTLLNLLTEGDTLVAASSLFGGTYSLFINVFQPLGINVKFVSITDLDGLDAAIDENTRVLFLETISNPCTTIPDFERISEIASRHHVVVVADSTATTPYLFPARRFGVNIVIHSTTKYISGGATSMGGAIVDLGNFDWSFVPALKKYHRYKEMAFLARLRKEVYQETGSCLSPYDAYLQSLGLETLALRMEQICKNAQAVAEFLEAQNVVTTVFYPGLPSSQSQELAKKQLNGKCGGILAFGLSDRTACFRFLDKLSLIKRASNLGDNKTLALHPASTIFAGLNTDEQKTLGIDDTLIRLSIGIEDADDIIADIRQALGES